MEMKSHLPQIIYALTAIFTAGTVVKKFTKSLT